MSANSTKRRRPRLKAAQVTTPDDPTDRRIRAAEALVARGATEGERTISDNGPNIDVHVWGQCPMRLGYGAGHTVRQQCSIAIAGAGRGAAR